MKRSESETIERANYTIRKLKTKIKVLKDSLYNDFGVDDEWWRNFTEEFNIWYKGQRGR